MTVNPLFRLICGVIATVSGSVLAIGDIWRLISQASCDASSLCITPSYRVPTQLGIQLYLAVITLAFGIAVIRKYKGGRLGVYTWLLVALLPSTLASLAYHVLMATSTTGIVQFDESKRGELGIDIVYDVFLLGLGVVLLFLHRRRNWERLYD